MATTAAVAHVSAVHGQAVARGRDGALRALRAGDPIFDGDVLVSPDGGRIEVLTVDGRAVIVQANETLTVDATVEDPQVLTGPWVIPTQTLKLVYQFVMRSRCDCLKYWTGTTVSNSRYTPSRCLPIQA